jgi:hypothetical protein
MSVRTQLGCTRGSSTEVINCHIRCKNGHELRVGKDLEGSCRDVYLFISSSLASRNKITKNAVRIVGDPAETETGRPVPNSSP